MCSPRPLANKHAADSPVRAFVAVSNEARPTLLKLGDSLGWVEAGELPVHIKAGDLMPENLFMTKDATRID
jgi:hypothetical protein